MVCDVQLRPHPLLHHLRIRFLNPLRSGSSLPAMSSSPPSPSSLPWWLAIFRRRISCTESHGDNPVVDCYACAEVGVPAFHSTSCDRAHQPEWQACAGSSLVPIQNRSSQKTGRNRRRPAVFDPRSGSVKRWNRAFLLARGVGLAVDPLFFYALSMSVGRPCLYMDGGLAAVATVLRTCVDGVQLCHLWLQFRLAYVSRKTMVFGCGKLVWDPRTIASHYVRSPKGFWFDVFVILPVPQAVFWLVIPKLIKAGQIRLMMSILLLIFLFQFLPKVYHSICLMRRMQKVTGYIFGTIWWGFGLNLIAYFIASHVAGGCWYVLAIQRAALCLKHYCDNKSMCNLSLSCSEEVCYSFLPAATVGVGNSCGGNSTAMSTSNASCLDVHGPYPYGIYKWALPVISSNSNSVKILYPIFWGLMTLSTFGNDLEPTSQWLEVVFSICMVLSGLMLFTLLIGNIQVSLHAVMAKKRKMLVRCGDMEWWMRRRQLPSELRQRVRHFEHQRWTAMGGEDDESEFIRDLPEGLRRDIRRYLCLDLIKKVPIFHSLDDLILDNICDRVKPLVFSHGEKIIREGDPVQRIIFIVRGRVKSSQNLSKGMVATSVLKPGGFLGDELLSWCLRRPFADRLPASSATFTCTKSTEAFALDATHLRYITHHFRYKFDNERQKRTARYYSSNWRTWAAVNIQLAWRRHVARTTGGPVTLGGGESGGERRLRQYAVMFMSLRPHDHLE